MDETESGAEIVDLRLARAERVDDNRLVTPLEVALCEVVKEKMLRPLRGV